MLRKHLGEELRSVDKDERLAAMLCVELLGFFDIRLLEQE